MPPISGDSVQDYVEKLLKENKIVIFSKTTCPWCVKVKQLFKDLNEEFVTVELDKIGTSLYLNLILNQISTTWFLIWFAFNLDNGDDIKNYIIKQTNQTTVPNVFINGNHVGGFDNTSKLQKEGRLAKMLNSGN